MADASASIQFFLSAIAAKQPTPGGGAVSAIAGALAAAIGEMVLNYSIGRRATPQFDEPLAAIVREWERARAMFLELMVEDQQAFAEYTAAKKLPDDAAKAAAVQAAADACIAVPRAIAATAVALLDRVEAVMPMANKYLLSDLAVCVELAMATLRTAIHCVKVNLPDQPEARRTGISAECDAELNRAVQIVRRVMQRLA